MRLECPADGCVGVPATPRLPSRSRSPDGFTVHVSNIAYEVTEQQLWEDWGRAGRVEHVLLGRGRCGRSLGYAAVMRSNSGSGYAPAAWQRLCARGDRRAAVMPEELLECPEVHLECEAEHLD